MLVVAPLHIGFETALMVIVGTAFTVAIIVAVLLQPDVVPVTV